MPSDRIQRQIDRLLDEADEAAAARNWSLVRALCERIQEFDPDNADATEYLEVAKRAGGGPRGAGITGSEAADRSPAKPLPASFAGGRYRVTSLLGQGGKKVVYQAHDTLLDRDVAFALLKTEGLDEAGRERVRREAQALGRLGSHPNIASVFDLGDEDGRPYIVTELLPGGDLAALIAGAPDRRLPLPRVLELAQAIAKAVAYAHGKGVIHRDLKPGNVWLAEDGTPKLGDFGLAMAGEDPRLTRAGMMVGTALYMAPEQATGGEVTARSDLYSLGCLLYELVCGRPPFVGDESVAIIGQHLQSTPVSPSWHRPDCPKPLEALILRLLEKDPTRRPASAQDVVAALAGISPSATRTTDESRQQVATPSGQSPVYGRIFVGREAELKQLEEAFDAASAGQGSLVIVVGEPGIGKTTLTEQLATYAGLRGGRVLVGHCYEDGSLSLPYLPFVEAIRTYVLDREPSKLQSELGNAAPEVARIVSEVRDRVQVEPDASASVAGEDRYRLLQGVCSFLRNAAAVQPLVLVLEDLHDADRGTLDLLQFLARQLSGARLLVAGTYRDVEVDRSHPLSATLAELRRSASFDRVLLRGLTADAVQRMIAAIAGQDIQWALAETVHRQTEGNPLFVQEVVRYLAESGLVQRKDGRWQATSVEMLLTSIPEGLRDVIGKRLSRLSADCNRLLAMAAVIGRDFTLQTLVVVSGEAEERVTELLDEAVKVAVLQEQAKVGGVQYRFTHAFFRQTLYEEISAARRLRLHQQVARALEVQYAGRLEEHAAELAEHFTHSTDPADLGEAVHYGRVAADRATSVYAYGEAVRLLERALDVQEVLAPDDTRTCCDLLIELGRVVSYSADPRRATETFAPQAYALAEALHDDHRASEAADVALRGLTMYGAGVMFRSPEYRQWAERLDQHARPATPERVRADMALFNVASGQGRAREAWAHGERALVTARALGDLTLLHTVVGLLVNWPGDVVHYARRRQLVEEFGDAPPFATVPLIGSSMPAMYYYAAANLCFQWGERDRYEALWQRLLAVTGQKFPQMLPYMTAQFEACLALLAGALDSAIEYGREYQRQMEARGAVGVAILMTVQLLWRPLLYLGRYEEALQLNSSMASYVPVVVLAHMGRRAEAREALRREPIIERVLRGDEDSPAPALAELLEAAVLVDDRDVAALIAERLRPIAQLASSFPPQSTVARHLGAAAALLGEREQAIVYGRQALAVARAVRFRPEEALVRLQLAEVLATGDVDEQRDASDHLGFAIAEFEAMGMRPALERALALRERLGAGGAGVATPEPATTPAPLAEPVPAPPPLRQVFISYGSHDLQRAVGLEALLKAEGLPVWLDKRSIPAGSSWDAEIVKGIRNSAVIAILCSPEAVQSPHVQQELRLAMEMRKPLLPLILRPTAYPDAVKYILTGQQWIELLERPEAEWFADVLTAVQRLAGEAQ